MGTGRCGAGQEVNSTVPQTVQRKPGRFGCAEHLPDNLYLGGVYIATAGRGLRRDEHEEEHRTV